MYHADQYAQPKGDYSKVYSADDAAWYKQYAADTVERKPYQAEDGKIAYHEKIVQKLPNPPQRKRSDVRTYESGTAGQLCDPAKLY